MQPCEVACTYARPGTSAAQAAAFSQARGGRMALVQPTISARLCTRNEPALVLVKSQCLRCTQPSLEMFTQADNDVGG